MPTDDASGHTGTSLIARGTLVALVAGALFGVTTPFVRHFGAGTGAFATAALLYFGSALGSGGTQRTARTETLRRPQRTRVVAAAVLGATLAPASLAWGLQHAGALAASLLLNLEAVFTVALARWIYEEPLGARFLSATSLMVAGGALLGVRAGVGGASSMMGLAAVLAASFAWALDNTITRPLADFDPRKVVLLKSSAGAVLAAAVAVTTREAWPSAWAAAALLGCGAVGYGFSLRLYLRAQRVLGAGRTGSLFAVAPFVGAAAAFVAGERTGWPFVATAGALFAAAAYLHATEVHGHRHRHEAIEHEHAHRHDDGHHTHAHDAPVAGEHTHVHRHEAADHVHSHGMDLHHRHAHE
jgi:drug/metabolite transporter (DMT)-like permease